ncbi:DUF2515 family protein [Mesobacillus zeae]|uniref:DUF2515 domain-containing protein n=1 Tax=Mesobacillus zeae TaxID=1917180 RepID=A0A398B8E5_9BACI|nr:DUF2515 family protein [Mesobacillus zeae]RID85771.1 DUF2515 domain-containing protein [Mesobacillus zeae]
MKEGWRIFFRRKSEKTPIEVIKEELKRRKKITIDKSLTKEEEMIIRQIKLKTKEWNKNNVTRTKAYLDFYQLHPEVHWAFLGHMVSRNGGWNMTDLKGELLSNLLSRKEKSSFFSFLERGNWLIFEDAYPQFLLYQESFKRNKPLFSLFRFFNISIFMETVWSYFWRNQNKSLLTIALIINEQNHLEKRVVKNPVYISQVFNTLEFKLQDVLSFNHILFPYLDNGTLNVAGQTLNQFQSAHERILLGKRLYAVLFNKDVLKSAEQWAKSHPHTGSRKDYWPHIFNNVHEGLPGKKYEIRLKSCRLRPGARKIYSPNLESVWKNVKHFESEEGEWFEDFQVLDYFIEKNEALDGGILSEYCKTLERLELAALAKKAIFIWD